MENQDIKIPAMVFVILILIFALGLKLSPIWSVVIALIGFGVAYFLLNKGGK